jgi:hypothetical protein
MMQIELSPDDVFEAASITLDALEPLIPRDWSVRAGELDWDVRTTVAHLCDAVGWYAAHLALLSRRRLRLDFHAHDDAANGELLDVVHAACATLAAVARAAPPGARGYHNAGMADTTGFIAMGCDEILVHGWDAVRGLGGDLSAPADLAQRILGRLFPWAPRDESAWPALLWANGRTDLPGHERLGPAWIWHCAPLDEWDGTVPHDDANPPTCYEWDAGARRWRPSR